MFARWFSLRVYLVRLKKLMLLWARDYFIAYNTKLKRIVGNIWRILIFIHILYAYSAQSVIAHTPRVGPISKSCNNRNKWISYKYLPIALLLTLSGLDSSDGLAAVELLSTREVDRERPVAKIQEKLQLQKDW